VTTDELSPDEKAFLWNRVEKDLRNYRRVTLFLCTGSLLFAMMTSFGVNQESKEIEFNWIMFAFLFILLLLISIGSVWFAYYFFTKDLRQDVIKGKKNVETCEIYRKHYTPVNDTYHFFIKSQLKISIEVSEEDFRAHRLGDEINIEYTPIAKYYLSYF
jgi:hypothetical protein